MNIVHYITDYAWDVRDVKFYNKSDKNNQETWEK